MSLERQIARRKEVTRRQHAHVLVAETAKALAGDLYERLMGDNKYYEAWKTKNPEATPKELEQRFIARNYGKCIPAARTTLALMLKGPLDDALKEQISEALCLDATLVRGRMRG